MYRLQAAGTSSFGGLDHGCAFPHFVSCVILQEALLRTISSTLRYLYILVVAIKTCWSVKILCDIHRLPSATAASRRSNQDACAAGHIFDAKYDNMSW